MLANDTHKSFSQELELKLQYCFIYNVTLTE